MNCEASMMTLRRVWLMWIMDCEVSMMASERVSLREAILLDCGVSMIE